MKKVAIKPVIIATPPNMLFRLPEEVWEGAGVEAGVVERVEAGVVERVGAGVVEGVGAMTTGLVEDGTGDFFIH